MVRMLRSGALIASRQPYSVVVLPEPVGPQTKEIAIGDNIMVSEDGRVRVTGLAAGGGSRELARHSVLASWDKGLFKLALPQDKRPLATQKERLAGTLSEYFGRAVKIEIELTDNVGESVAVRDNRVRDEKQAAAEAAFMADPAVQVLLSEGGGRVRAGSIQATES